MEKNYVEIQGRFSSDGRFVGGNYVPEVIDKLMNDVYSTLGQAGSLCKRNAALPCPAAFDRWKADSCTGHLPCRH